MTTGDNFFWWAIQPLCSLWNHINTLFLYWGEDLMSALGPSEGFSHLFTSSYTVKGWWWFCLWYLKSLLCGDLSRNLIKKGDKRKWCVFPRGIFLTLNIWSQNRRKREVNKHGKAAAHGMSPVKCYSALCSWRVIGIFFSFFFHSQGKCLSSK